MDERLKTAEQLIHMVPAEELDVVNEFLRQVIRAWDPDFTKVTASEQRDIALAEIEYADGDTCSDCDVW